jgi:serine/threonine-protein kinase
VKSLIEFQAAEIGVKRTARYIEDVARQLTELHCLGRLHGNICPYNIILDHIGGARLLPNEEILSDDGSDTLTPDHAEEIANFLAPECAVRGSVDTRADVYSLGCVLYFLLVGRAPFAWGTIAERLLRHQAAKPIGIHELRLDAPSTLVQICDKMMAKRPGDRFQSAEELVYAVMAWRHDPS